MSDTPLVEVKTTIRINDETGNVDIVIQPDGDLYMDQSNDNIKICRDSALALARIILQHHQVKFEPVFIQEVDYTK